MHGHLGRTAPALTRTVCVGSGIERPMGIAVHLSRDRDCGVSLKVREESSFQTPAGTGPPIANLRKLARWGGSGHLDRLPEIRPPPPHTVDIATLFVIEQRPEQVSLGLGRHRHLAAGGRRQAEVGQQALGVPHGLGPHGNLGPATDELLHDATLGVVLGRRDVGPAQVSSSRMPSSTLAV